MPVSTKERSIHNTHVSTDALNFLGIPQREGVIVAMSHENTVLADGIQVILSHLDCSIAVAAVVVIPVLRSHQDRHSKEKNGNHSCRNDSPRFI